MAGSVKEFLAAAAENADLQDKMENAASQEAIVDIAKAAGFDFTVADLVAYQDAVDKELGM